MTGDDVLAWAVTGLMLFTAFGLGIVLCKSLKDGPKQPDVQWKVDITPTSPVPQNGLEPAQPNPQVPKDEWQKRAPAEGLSWRELYTI